MRYLVLSLVVLLAGCDNTMNGLGRDMQNAGADLSDRTESRPPPPPPPPPSRYDYDSRPPVYQGR